MHGADAVGVVLGACVACSACTAPLRQTREWLEVPGQVAVATTNGPNASMIYVARTDAGPIVIDLGWAGAEDAVRGALARLGAAPESVAAVLLTHAHRDHVGGWHAVARAPFYVGAAELPIVAGTARPRGWIPRLAERLRRTREPRGVTLRAIGGDTTLVFGRDSVRAFALPGHTAGSMAYLFRGVLFVGDGASHFGTLHRDMPLRPARAGYSDDTGQARRSLARVLNALPAGAVRVICTAHARCAPDSPAVRDAITRPSQDS